MELVLKFFQVGCGDCVSIHFNDYQNQYYTIIIDSGYVGTYHRTLHKEVTQLIKYKRTIDLFVLTHTDSDHIGGIKVFLKSFGTNFVDTFWFNWVPNRQSPFVFEPNRKASSIRQAIDIRDKLIIENKLNSEPIIAFTQKQIGNALITVLSPNLASYNAMKDGWEKEEERLARSRRVEAAKKNNDYSVPIEKLIQASFVEDNATENGSSIAFLFEWEGWRGLFLADSHPSVVEEALLAMGYTPDNLMRVDLVKIAHHGSSHNTSPTLLSLIDCQTFLISANGTNRDNLPTKEALARIVTYAGRDKDIPINFLFNHDNPTLRSIFTSEECQQYCIRCYYPSGNTNAYEYIVKQPGD